MTPSDLALGAREVARRRGVTLKILDTTQMEKLGMNALLGVPGEAVNRQSLLSLNIMAAEKAIRRLH